MKRLKITDDHGFTARKLRKEERKIKDASLRQRVTAVRLIMEGYLGKEVAEMLNLHRQSVSTYVQLFNEGGLEKLLDKKTPPGKSPYLTEEQQKKLKHMILHSTPFEQGLGMATSWDTRIIPSYLQNQYGISMTRVGVNKMLHRLGLSYTRPTYTLTKGDEQKQRAFVQEMEMIKKLMTGDMVVLYADETHIRSYQALRTTWAEAGKQKQIPTYGHHASVTLFGAVNVLDGKVVVQQASACNTGSFLEVVQRILQTYQGKYVLLVLDNARIHHAKQVQEFLRKHEEPIMFFFLPPYSPHLNAIERLWKWLERVCHCQPISQRSSCH